MKNKKQQKTKYPPRHICKWCGAGRFETKMKQIKSTAGPFWVCTNGDVCAATAAQYRPKK